MRYSPRLFPSAVVLAGCLAACAVGRGDERSLQLGDVAPEFQCLDDRGQDWTSRDHVGGKLIVYYFYRSDFSFCCTRQAVKYRDAQRELEALGVEVIGISGDAVETHRQFRETSQLPQPLLSDADGSISRQFGVPLRYGGKAMVKAPEGEAVLTSAGQAHSIPRTVTAARSTFIVNQCGQIIYREDDVSPVRDCQEVLEFLRKPRPPAVTPAR